MAASLPHTFGLAMGAQQQFFVAQICNLLYRPIAFGRALEAATRFGLAKPPQDYKSGICLAR